MQDLMNLFFGPLGMKYCNIFFAYTAFSLFFLILVIWMTIMSIIKRKFSWNVVAILIVYFAIYLQNRVLYNMCMARSM